MEKLINELLEKANENNQLSEEYLIDISEKNNVGTIEFMELCDSLCNRGISIVPEKDMDNSSNDTPLIVGEDKQAQIEALFLSLSLSEQYDCVANLISRLKESAVPSIVKKEKTWNDGTDLSSFLASLNSSSSRYSYTYVLIKAFLSSTNKQGVASLDSVIDCFRHFYIERQNKGLKVEQHNSILVKRGTDYQTVRCIILYAPLLKSYLKNYLTYDKCTNTITMLPDLWLQLTDELKKEIIDCSDAHLKKYFDEI